jgi:hypothetical protein
MAVVDCRGIFCDRTGPARGELCQLEAPVSRSGMR